MLLSFRAGESIQVGDAVTIAVGASGHIYTARTSGTIGEASSVGVSVDTVSSGALCRVVTDAKAEVYSGLNTGSRYFVSASGGTPVTYDTFVAEFNQIGVSGAFIVDLGVALSTTALRVSPQEPKPVVSGYL